MQHDILRAEPPVRLLTRLRARLFGSYHAIPVPTLSEGGEDAMPGKDAVPDHKVASRTTEAAVTEADASTVSCESPAAEAPVEVVGASRTDQTTCDDAHAEPLEPPADASLVVARQEQAAGRILDDEGLRGDLTDDEFQPLQDWALSVTDRLAAATALLDDAQADGSLDAGLEAVKSVVRLAGEAVAAQAEGDAHRVRGALSELVGRLEWLAATSLDNGTETASRLQALGDSLAERADVTSLDLAGEIVAALSAAQADGMSDSHV